MLLKITPDSLYLFFTEMIVSFAVQILKFLSSHLSTVDHITEMNWATHWFQKHGIILGQDGTELCACASVQNQRKVLHREL